MSFLLREYHYFLAAVQFLTRIKVPDSFPFKPEYLEGSTRYFPLVGNVVAAFGALAYLVIGKYISEDLAIVGYMLTTIWVTGAFHEDGFADVCDAFGGGWTKEKILLIMKDSRIGTYGTVGLIGILAVKFLLVRELPSFAPEGLQPSLFALANYQIFLLLLLAAHGTSRLMAVTVIQQYTYVRDDNNSKSKPLSRTPLSWPALMAAIVFACWPFLFLSWPFALVLVPMFIARTALASFFKKWIGGYTGDCLGTVQQVTEIVFYLTALILWRYFV
ncbi:adenosylcobinamide-GDP ribazoletransferase [Flavihumibacter rivuli]|uniref:adenosylcobinamide-GDP ribazoletransferase n=1 Tax=Flavihumibacter rivuli TaxID=2838156 RepID=UPI001BDF4422|nr:adenosylcobinamide-GDP ribazoletransferase [Flavihumibacter rivuli]ULQ56284.1 adenosylcobinamide-GDP ribazoletransferase [Flavihumibacter rivuli]